MAWIDDLKFDDDGLLPVVAQEAATGEILMLAFADREALEATVRTGNAHYHSRSRGRLWMKGETSGHTQRVIEVRVDCDGDAVLYRVQQTGPACHTLNPSCFFRRVEGGALVEGGSAGHILGRLAEVIADRRENPKPGAYTNYLFEQGVDKILKKVGEETTEVVVAAKNEGAGELVAETADLLFHLAVLFEARNLPLDTVWNELEARFGREPRSRRNSQDRSTNEP